MMLQRYHAVFAKKWNFSDAFLINRQLFALLKKIGHRTFLKLFHVVR